MPDGISANLGPRDRVSYTSGVLSANRSMRRRLFATHQSRAFPVRVAPVAQSLCLGFATPWEPSPSRIHVNSLRSDVDGAVVTRLLRAPACALVERGSPVDQEKRPRRSACLQARAPLMGAVYTTSPRGLTAPSRGGASAGRSPCARRVTLQHALARAETFHE